MDDLKPSQLILLSVLVTFITSIATTVVSLSLLADTPLSITQVVNRVVETERADAEALEALKEELLLIIDERTASEPLPEVAGVSDIRAELLFDLIELAPRRTDGGRQILADGLELVSAGQEASGDVSGQYLTVGESTIEITPAFSGGFTFAAWPAEQAVFVVDAERGQVAPIEAFGGIEEVVSSGLIASLVEVPACAFAESWIMTVGGDVAGLCVAQGLALVSIERIPIDSSDSSEAHDENETAPTDV